MTSQIDLSQGYGRISRLAWMFIPFLFMCHIVLVCCDTMGLFEYEYAESQRRSTRR